MSEVEKLKIGVSLSPLYLSEHEDEVDSKWFGKPDNFLKELSKSGVTHIELRAIRAATSLETGETALKRVYDNGLEATIHGVLPALDDDNWTQTHATIISLLEKITKRYEGSDMLCPIAMHCFASKDKNADKQKLAADSAKRLKEIANWLVQHQLSAQIALEINREKKSIDPSTTYQGVVNMHQKTNHSRVGICWDMGHTWANIENGYLEKQPAKEFVQNVVHTHIHDLGGPNYRTHWPLTEDNLPLEWFTRQLVEAGYNGVWNLEFEPKRYADEPKISERIIKSVDKMIETINKVTDN